jgi:hypothetical protein
MTTITGENQLAERIEHTLLAAAKEQTEKFVKRRVSISLH